MRNLSNIAKRAHQIAKQLRSLDASLIYALALKAGMTQSWAESKQPKEKKVHSKNISFADLIKLSKDWTFTQNEGHEGYNPYSDELSRRSAILNSHKFDFYMPPEAKHPRAGSLLQDGRLTKKDGKDAIVFFLAKLPNVYVMVAGKKDLEKKVFDARAVAGLI